MRREQLRGLSIRYLVLILCLFTWVNGVSEEHYKIKCQSDSDCDAPYLLCSESQKICVRKGLFPMLRKGLLILVLTYN